MQGTLRFAYPPDSQSSPVTLEPVVGQPASPNSGPLRLEPNHIVNSPILVHESRMFDALLLLDSLSDVEGLAFEQAHAMVLRRVKEELQRIDTIKAREWNRLLRLVRNGQSISHGNKNSDSWLDIGMFWSHS